MANRLERLAAGPRPVPPKLQTEGHIVHGGIAKLAPGLSIGDLVDLRSAGPCFIVSVTDAGNVEVRKQDGSRQFTMLCPEFKSQFRAVLDYASPISA